MRGPNANRYFMTVREPPYREVCHTCSICQNLTVTNDKAGIYYRHTARYYLS